MLEDGEGGLFPEAHLLLVELDEVLVLDVCNEHCDADYGRGFLNVVRGPSFILHFWQAKEIYLLCFILDVWVDIFRFGQSCVGIERPVCGDF